MKLFNKTIDKQLFKQYPLGSDLSKQEVVVKIFNPYGRGTWFIINSDPEDPDYLWAIVDLGYGAEVGSVSRSDLENYRNRMGLGFERDLSFDPVNALELFQGVRTGEFYVKGGNLSRDRKFLNHSQKHEVRYSQGKNRKGYGSFSFDDGGEIENFSDNQRMIMNQNVEVEHHQEELEDILEDKIEVPAWVVAKMETATQNLSDITHYLDGQKELKEEEQEDDDDVMSKDVVEPIVVGGEDRSEIFKNFTNDAWGNFRGFLKGMEGIDLRDDYTFGYKDEQFEIEPIINTDENGVSNAVFTIFDGDGEEVGEVMYSREGGKQKFTANSEFFGWNNAKFENGGGLEKVRWQDVEKGDSARVKELNRMGLITHAYGRKFNLKFIDGTEKTFDASELEFYKLEKDHYDKGESMAFGGDVEAVKMYLGDPVMYQDELWYISEKNGVVGLVNMNKPPRGGDYPFVPISKIMVSQQVTDMMGRKVRIPYLVEDFERGGSANGGSLEELLPKDKLLNLLRNNKFKSFDSSKIKEIKYENQTINPFDKSFVLQIDADPCLVTIDKIENGFEVAIGEKTNWYGGFSFASWEYVFEISNLTFEDFSIGLKKAMADKNISLYSKWGTGNVDSVYFYGTIEEAIKFGKKNGYEFKDSKYFYNPSFPTWKNERILKIGRFTKSQIENLGGVKDLVIEKENTVDKPKYILKADIKTVTVKRNGKEVTYKGADVYNGANMLSGGGDLSSKANYIPKRDVVEVELKDGSKVKPVNGYWVKKGAEPIGNEPTPKSSEPKIGITRIKKDSRNNWRAETNIENFNGYDWRLSTVKTYSGKLISSAQAGKTEDTGNRGINMFIYKMYQDPNHTLEVSSPKRLTDKVVSEQHDKALAKFKKFMETGMFKGGGEISNFDKLSAKVAEQYEGKPVKGSYQEEYGKYYSKEEAQEVGDKVAGKVKAMQSDKKAFGGLFGGTTSFIKTKKHPNLDDQIVYTKGGEAVMVVDQSSDTLLVIDANKIGTGVLPRKMNISEIDPTSYKSGGAIKRGKSHSGRNMLKEANDLAKKIRKDGESWQDAKKRAFAQLKN